MACLAPTRRSGQRLRPLASWFVPRPCVAGFCQPVKSRCTLVVRPGSFSARSKARQVFPAGIVCVIVPADFQPALCQLLDGLRDETTVEPGADEDQLLLDDLLLADVARGRGKPEKPMRPTELAWVCRWCVTAGIPP